MLKTASPSLGDRAAAALEKCGTGHELASKLQITKSAVSQWKHTGIPAQRLGAIAALSGLDPHDIRPDLFPQRLSERAA